jgi:hypothetical protein
VGRRRGGDGVGSGRRGWYPKGREVGWDRRTMRGRNGLGDAGWNTEGVQMTSFADVARLGLKEVL